MGAPQVVVPANAGVAGESGRIRIGTVGTHTQTKIAGIHSQTSAGGIAVLVKGNGVLGTTTSSARFKRDVREIGVGRRPGLGLRLSALALCLGGLVVAPSAAAEKASIASITSSGPCAYVHPSDARIVWTCRPIPRGETLETLFGDSWRAVARFNRIDRRHAGPGVWIKVPDRLAELAEFTPMPQRYSPADSEARFILIDLTEQFLGAYEYGALVLSAPVATGRPNNPTPAGDFRIDAADLRHRSSKYTIANTAIPYPMHYGLRFLRTPRGVTYWIHGRDLPGYPASHGCVGLYDEAMQVRYYGEPKDAALDDARRLFEWAVGPLPEGESVRKDLEGPRVRVVGRAPRRGGTPR